ncbi:MAG: LEA type 2 family protein [Nitrospirota bacterium]
MTNKISLLIYIFIILLAAGCATLQTDYEEPSVVITDFRSIPSGGIAPRFEIGLHIINPNRTALDLKGISYTVKLEGHKVLTGVSNKLPLIDAYGEGDVKLAATADLFGSISLLTDMIQNQRNAFRYVLDVKMDTGGFRPNIRVRKEGNISLAPE